MCQNFVSIHRQTVGEGAREERKSLSRVINQNAALEKNKPVSIPLFNRYFHIGQTSEEKNEEICLCCSKKSHLPVLLVSIPFFSHTLENALHVDPLWMNLTGIKILHTNQPHLLKNEILSS